MKVIDSIDIIDPRSAVLERQDYRITCSNISFSQTATDYNQWYASEDDFIYLKCGCHIRSQGNHKRLRVADQKRPSVTQVTMR